MGGCKRNIYLAVLILFLSHRSRGVENDTDNLEVDPNGYIVYCPCMGRFGNQADQFLGSLAFAKAVNRTLILPPWVEYPPVMTPFDTYFQVSPLQEYHRVITMETFMAQLADSVWPKEKRKAFCYVSRWGSGGQDDCNAKDGSPFGPFWDWHSVDFVGSEIFSPLYYETHIPSEMSKWNERFPNSEYPVLSFVGPPASFPVKSIHTYLQKYVQWQDSYTQRAVEFIRQNLPEGPYIGIHLRNGVDFERACEHIHSSPDMFAAKQCVGERGQWGKTTHEMCLPSTKTVVKQVKKEVKLTKAKAVFIATDNNDLIPEFSKAMPTIKFVRQPHPASAMLDLAILGRADYFIGNCISTFSAFVKRERVTQSLPTSFWAFKPKHIKDVKDEL